MKPPSFLYARPATLDEAVMLAGRYGDEAKLLAGGQSLLPILNLRFAEPKVLIDLNRVPGLDGIDLAAGELRLGALARHRDVELSETVRAAHPLLARAAAEIGHLAIRNRGTIGGSLVHADPAAEWPLVAVALDARIHLRSNRGERAVAARAFFAGPLTSAAAPDEIVTHVVFPASPPRSRYGFRELSRRPGDFAIVAVACRVTLDEDGTCRGASLAVAGAHGTPLHVREAEAILVGGRGEDDAIHAVVETVTGAVDPGSDVHGSAAYRRRMAGVLSLRALGDAFGRGESA